MNVGDICRREVVTITPGDRIVEAARRMREEHVGDLVVVDRREGRRVPVGIITDRDIVIGVVARDTEHLDKLEVGDVVTAELVTAREDEDLEAVVHRMRAHGIRRVPVVTATGELAGMLAYDDLIDHLGREIAELADLAFQQRRREAWTRP